MQRLTRRKLFVTAGALVGGALLSQGCKPPPAPPPTGVAVAASSQPVRTPTNNRPNLPATSTPYPTPVIKTYRRPEIARRYPDVNSRVVKAVDPRAWNGDNLSPEVLRDLVDRTITSLTQQTDVREAWQALFSPAEKIAIKVNAFRYSLIWTHPALVYAVTGSMVAAGIPAENITIFDYYTSELETAGFTINKDGPGVRCYGTDEAYATTWHVAYALHKISDILMGADAVINMPILKQHDFTGITFAMKNHYGCVQSPNLLHSMPYDLIDLNSLPVIKDATRLVIGDARRQRYPPFMERRRPARYDPDELRSTGDGQGRAGGDQIAV
jgi:hypothetical protein